MINTTLTFYHSKIWHEIICYFPEIPLIGHCINCEIDDDIDCDEWIVTDVIHHVSRIGTHNYVEVVCKPKE